MRFDTLLIANRGEIALRVIKTAQRLGLRTVAVYSDADIEARHVREADMAVHIGPADSALSYRNISAIIDACRRSGAQAVHPGYGFLSENPAFAQAVLDAGLVFVGPSPDVIDLMGNKYQAKAAMEAAGVPTVPGERIHGDDADILMAARRIGFPVIFKATAGGGGRGMRVALNEASLLDSFKSARSEAMGSFGSDEIIIERAIECGRHIEIQVLCDKHGNCVHLGERDCSMQRRFQKVIEEAPSPAVSPALREAMGEIARKACEAIGYTGVGTLEFLLDADGAFYFMEMNTRLQVEHGVTELITGVDLVEQQIRVAQGEVLGIAQDDIVFQGHAIELRVCAEDPDAGFLPEVGRIERWCEPGGIRIDTFLENGTQISPYYDSMMAKFLAHASDRTQAIQKLSLACSNTVLLGIRNNLAFLRQAINHPVFLQGNATTQFLGNEDFQHPHWRRLPSLHATLAAAFALGDMLARPGDKERRGLSMRPQYMLEMQYATPTGQAQASQLLLIRPLRNGYAVKLGQTREDLADSAEIIVDYVLEQDSDVICVVDGVRRKLPVAHSDRASVWVQDGASAWRYARRVREAREEVFVDDVLMVRAPMTGKVISVVVNRGDLVEANQTLLVIESMKMEIPVFAGLPGAVGKINTTEGQQISAGQLLMEITQL
ncbi:ATP-grasp domain-containing protein [Alcaligenaceae bacterium]|nr:ATP-grasp domain-containing protein [Alcaligenaceae bacterium]